MENDSINARKETRKSLFGFVSKIFAALLVIDMVIGLLMAARGDKWILLTAMVLIGAANAWFASFLDHLSRGSTEKFAVFRATIIALFVSILFGLLCLALAVKH